MPAKRRRLSDLYVVGKPFVVSDPQGEVEVWLQKINPLERETAVRRAGAARARTLAFFEDKDSDEYQSSVNDVVDFYSDRESLIAMVTRGELHKDRQRIEAELAGSEEWTKDGLLVGLIDSWQDDLSDRYAEDPKDPEAKKVFDKLKKFDAEVDKQVETARKRLEREHEALPDSALREIAVERLVEAQAMNAFIEEFEVQRLLFGVRDPDDHSAYYFSDAKEIKSLEEEVKNQLSIGYAELEVDVVEGKDSPGTEDSSPSSEESGTQDQGPASGLRAVKA